MLPVLPQIVARGCAHGTRVAVYDRTGRYTYDQLDRASASVALRLLDGRDDLREARVAFLVAPGFDWIAIQWGIWRAGGIAVPLPLSHPPAELDYLIRDSDASIVIADADNAAVIEPVSMSCDARFYLCDALTGAPYDPYDPHDPYKPHDPRSPSTDCVHERHDRPAQRCRDHARRPRRANPIAHHGVGMDVE